MQFDQDFATFELFATEVKPDDFAQQAHAILRAAAIVIGALVVIGIEKIVQQALDAAHARSVEVRLK